MQPYVVHGIGALRYCNLGWFTAQGWGVDGVGVLSEAGEDILTSGILKARCGGRCGGSCKWLYWYWIYHI